MTRVNISLLAMLTCYSIHSIFISLLHAESASPHQCILRDNPTVLRPIPSDRINDNYCDCQDGSDEPLTAACPGNKFRCINSGHAPTSIPSSWVSDSYCDCCDGSDERDGQCPNRCKELNRVALAEANRYADVIRRGIAIRSTYAAKARRLSADDRRHLAAKQRELNTVSSSLELAKKRADTLKSARGWHGSQTGETAQTQSDGAASDHKRHADDDYDDDDEYNYANEDNDEDPSRSDSNDKVKTEDHELDKDSIPVDDHDDAHDDAHDDSAKDEGGHAPDGDTGNGEGHTDDHASEKEDDDDYDYGDDDDDDEAFDEDDEYGSLDEDEGDDGEGDDDFGEDDEGLGDAEDEDELGEEEDFKDEGKHSDTVPSDKDSASDETSKTVSSSTTEPTTDTDPNSANVDTMCAELEGVGSNALVRKARYLRALLITRFHRLLPSAIRTRYGASISNIDSCIQQANDAKHKLESRERELKQEIEKLEKQSSTDYGPDNVLRSLHGSCTKVKVLQYEFEHCPFDIVRQFEHGSAIATLGRFQGWRIVDGESVMSYAHGDRCWNGPVRTIKVQLLCGEKEDIVSVDEPNRCSYFMKFKTPAVCDLKMVDDILAKYASSEQKTKEEL